MQPLEELVPGLGTPDIIYVRKVTYAKDQPQYRPLPSYRARSGEVFTRWRLTWREWARVFFTRDIYITTHTFGDRLQPISLDTTCPIEPDYDPPRAIAEGRV